MRCGTLLWRLLDHRAALLGTCAVAAVAAWPAPAAQAAQVLRSGDYVVFKGTSLQCLAFGPVRVGGTPTSGVLCFKGPPKQHLTDSWWMAVTYQGSGLSSGNVGGDEPFRAAIRGTSIRRTLRISAAGAELALPARGGARISCSFRASAVVDPGRKAVSCVGEGSGWRARSGFVLSQRRLASVKFGAGWSVRNIDASWDEPRCSCDG